MSWIVIKEDPLDGGERGAYWLIVQEDPLDRGPRRYCASSVGRIHSIVEIENPVGDCFEGCT